METPIHDTESSSQSSVEDQDGLGNNITSSISIMDLDVYKGASEGNMNFLREKRDHLHQILTPTKPEEVLKSTNIVEQILEMCPPLLLQPNESGETTLHIAARHGHASIVEVLIEAGKAHHADLEINRVLKAWEMLIRATNKEKDTPLHEAVHFNHLGVVRILTREDPKCSYSANDGGETPLHLAIERGYRDLFFEILSTCTDPVFEGPNGRTALHTAVIFNDKEITRKLLDTKRDLTKAIDEQGWTPLHFAAFFGHISIVKQLLDADRSASYIGDKDDKKTALHIAASEGHVDVMKELIFRCPDCCELVDHKCRNVLHYAIEKLQIRIWIFVLKNPWLSNILLNGKDVDGMTPLHQLVQSHPYEASNRFFFVQIVMVVAPFFICDARVDKTAVTNENQNAFDIMLAHDTYTLLKGFYKRVLRMDGARPSHRIVRDKDIGGCRKLVREKTFKGVDNDDRNKLSTEVKEAHLVVAALIATVTFAAGFTMPGGYVSEKGPDQGFAVLSRNAAFKAFVITDTTTMIFSSCSVFMHFFSSVNSKRKGMKMTVRLMLTSTIWALISMVIAFITGTYAVFGNSAGLATAACVLACFLCTVITSSNFRIF